MMVSDLPAPSSTVIVNWETTGVDWVQVDVVVFPLVLLVGLVLRVGLPRAKKPRNSSLFSP